MEPTELMLSGTSPHQDLSKYDEGVWELEEKLDGERIQAIKENGRVRLFSRNRGKDGDFVEYTHAAPRNSKRIGEI